MESKCTISVRSYECDSYGHVSKKIARDGQTVAEAEVTWVCVDARGHPARLPPAFDKEGLQP